MRENGLNEAASAGVGEVDEEDQGVVMTQSARVDTIGERGRRSRLLQLLKRKGAVIDSHSCQCSVQRVCAHFWLQQCAPLCVGRREGSTVLKMVRNVGYGGFVDNGTCVALSSHPALSMHLPPAPGLRS